MRSALRITCGVIFAGAAWVGATWVYYATTAPPRQADVLVVLGGGQQNGALTDLSAARINHAAALYRQGLAPAILLSGGSTNPISEAELMRQRLAELGVPPGVITLEEASLSTLQNALFSAPLIRDRTALLVTQPFHMGRARASFAWAGIENRPASAPWYGGPWDVTRIFVREIAATWFNLFRALAFWAAQALGADADPMWLSGLDAPKTTRHPRA